MGADGDAQNQKSASDGRKVHDQKMPEHVVPERPPLADDAEAQTALHHEAVSRAP